MQVVHLTDSDRHVLGRACALCFLYSKCCPKMQLPVYHMDSSIAGGRTVSVALARTVGSFPSSGLLFCTQYSAHSSLKSRWKAMREDRTGASRSERTPVIASSTNEAASGLVVTLA